MLEQYSDRRSAGELPWYINITLVYFREATSQAVMFI